MILQSAGHEARYPQQGREAVYPTINSIPTEDKFKDVIDRAIITANFEYRTRLSGDS